MALVSLEKEDKIVMVLERLGLHKNERAVYLDLIKNRFSGVTEISKRTKIHRTNVYDALNNLIAGGFISESHDMKRKLFKALDPEKLKDHFSQMQHDVDEVIANIRQLKQSINEQQGANEVFITNGRFAARNSLTDLIKINKQIYVIGASKEALEVFGMGFLGQFHKDRIKKKIQMNHIYNQDVGDRIDSLNKMKYTGAKHLAAEYDTTAATIICGDIVLLIIFSKPVSVITIKNKEIAESYRKYFKILWEKAIA